MEDRTQQLNTLLNQYEEQITNVLPNGFSFQKVKQTYINSLMLNPNLIQCDKKSIIMCLMTVLQMGLSPDTNLGHAFFDASFDENTRVWNCNVIIGYKGLLKLAYQSSLVKNVTCKAVYEGDNFSYSYGLVPELSHRRSEGLKQKTITHFYAIVYLNSGGYIYEVMELSEVLEIRNNTKSYQQAEDKTATFWELFFEDMGCKTALRKVFKYTPLSTEIEIAVKLDDFQDLRTDKVSKKVPKGDSKRKLKKQSLENILDGMDTRNG